MFDGFDCAFRGDVIDSGDILRDRWRGRSRAALRRR
jgi:hypothetical protein